MHDAVLLPILLTVAGFGLVAVASGWLAAKPLHAAYLGLAMIVLEAFNLPLSINYGIWLYPADLLFLIILVACLSRFCLFVSPRTVPGTWWMIGAVQLLLLVWGYRTIGSRAGVDYRVHFYLWVSVCYFCSVEWTESMVRRVLDGWIACALALCLLACYRWLYSMLDPVYAQEIMGMDTTGVKFRVVSSFAALVIAVAFVIMMFRMLSGRLPHRQRILLPVFLLTVVVLQHRSVWISLVAGVVCLLWVGRMGSLRGLMGIGLLVLPLAIFFTMSSADNSVVTSITTSATNALSTKEGTMVARMGNWQELLANWAASKNPVTYLIGKPYGSGYNPMDSEDGEDVIDMVPHNHFVHILYRGGLIALGATLVLFYQLATAAIRLTRSGNKPSAACFVGIFGAFLAYFIPYWAAYGNGILIGIAVSYLGIRNMHALRAPAITPKYDMRGH